jgi:hypothetical protein
MDLDTREYHGYKYSQNIFKPLPKADFFFLVVVVHSFAFNSVLVQSSSMLWFQFQFPVRKA